MNPILNQMRTPQIPRGQIQQLMNVLQCANNPEDAIRSMMATNPQLKELFPLIQRNGGDYKKAFYDLAQQKGIDPESFLQQLK